MDIENTDRAVGELLEIRFDGLCRKFINFFFQSPLSRVQSSRTGENPFVTLPLIVRCSIPSRGDDRVTSIPADEVSGGCRLLGGSVISHHRDEKRVSTRLNCYVPSENFDPTSDLNVSLNAYFGILRPALNSLDSI